MINPHTKTKKKLLFIFGTRPEAIKLAPLIKEFQKRSKIFDIKVCITAQHRKMLDQVMHFFKIPIDYDLNIMRDNQTLFDVTVKGIKGLEKVIKDVNPHCILIQGDTTTAFIGALTGFYEKIKVAHIEAGLRSFNKHSPFPEEINRVLVGHLADYHFAPTQNAKKNLLAEGINNNVYVVGNTVIDALFLGLKIIKKENLEDKFLNKYKFLNYSKRLILVTAHRRESFGKQFENICMALKEISINNNDVEIIYPVHLNPEVRKPVFNILKNIPNIHLIEPIPYPDLIWLMSKCYLILTDSGGIQEEAPSLGKPVLVMREVTERIEGLKIGNTRLVGTNKSKIIFETQKLLNDRKEYIKMSRIFNLYGDGKASKRIVQIISKVI